MSTTAWTILGVVLTPFWLCCFLWILYQSWRLICNAPLTEQGRYCFAVAWYDLWVGAYWSHKNRTLYICPLPCCVFAVRFGEIAP